ncbi:unnamed protein product [Oikopleura dioica]|uniref:Uncharacterized protein n=1 Tax=Oikopleura dioica TaxID=34765 RepID=E4Z2S9_OIKDI|nr:unnamed protein product [Oikopleura dioica]
MELQAAKYASSLHKLLTKFKGVKKQGKELAESICSRKTENKSEDFDKKLNQKCANLLELSESANSIGLTMIENSKKWKSLPKAFSLMSESTDLISKSSCCEIANETESVANQIIKQASLWINLCGKIYHLEESDDLIYIVACWAHQPLVNENAFELLAAKSKYISAYSA